MSATLSLFRRKLDVLGCPFIDSPSDDVIKELLFTPGEHRLRLMQWIFGKIDSNIYHHIDKQPKFIGGDDWRWANLLSASSALGLASRSEMDVISGVASEEKQISFFEKLFNLAVVMDCVESADGVSGQSNLREQYMRDSHFLTQVVAHNSKSNAFPHSVSLLPMDLNRLVQENWKEKAWKSGERPPMPDRKHLSRRLADLQEQLIREKSALQELQSKNFISDKLDDTTKACLRSRYNVVLNGLVQILTDFSYCFANDMEVWCTTSETPLDQDELGPCVKQANKLLKGLNSIVQDMRSLALLPAETSESSGAAVIESKLERLNQMKKNFDFHKIISREKRNDDN